MAVEHFANPTPSLIALAVKALRSIANTIGNVIREEVEGHQGSLSSSEPVWSRRDRTSTERKISWGGSRLKFVSLIGGEVNGQALGSRRSNGYNQRRNREKRYRERATQKSTSSFCTYSLRRRYSFQHAHFKQHT